MYLAHHEPESLYIDSIIKRKEQVLAIICHFELDFMMASSFGESKVWV